MADEHTNTKRRDFTYIAITYHPSLVDSFDVWALACSSDTHSLKHETESAIRTRHNEATIHHDSSPDVLTLSLGSVQVFYSVELHRVVVRGYGWEIDGEAVDDYDGGGFYVGTF